MLSPNDKISIFLQAQAWKTVFGNTNGKTPLAKISRHTGVLSHAFQLSQVKFQASPIGWPILVLEAYTMDFKGEDRLIGANGDGLFFIHGKVPEFNNPSLLAQASSRGQISTQSRGDYIEVDVNVAVV